MAVSTICGKGNMGTAIAGVAEAGGAMVEHPDTSSIDAKIKADVVILAVPADSSAAEKLTASLPSSKVLKAFNTNFPTTLGSRLVGAHKTTVLIAGDDIDPKRTLAGFVQEGGISALDAGSLPHAREFEAVGFLQLTLAASEQILWRSAFALVR